MTATEWQIISPKIDILCNELDKALADTFIHLTAVDRVINALSRYGKLTWHSLIQYTCLRSDVLADALSVAMDGNLVGHTDGAIKFYFLKG